MAKALEILKDRLLADSLELTYDNIEGIPTLRMIVDSVGEDEDGLVVVELSEIPVDESAPYGYFHFMSIMANKLEEANFKGTTANLNQINLDTLLGHYLIIEEAGTLAHKYVLKVRTDDENKAAEDLYNCLIDIVAIVNGDYDRVLGAIE